MQVLRVLQHFLVLLGLGLELFQLFLQLVLLLFFIQHSHLEVVLVSSLQVECVLLSKVGLLHPSLVFLHALLLGHDVALLLGECFILDHGLLKD